MEEIIDQIQFLSTAPEDIIEKCRIKLIQSLDEFSLDSDSYYERIKVLTKLVNKCNSLNSSKLILEPILVKWSGESLSEYYDNSRFDADGILGDLASTTLCKIGDLKYALNLYEDCTPMSVLDSHVRNCSYMGMSFKLVCSRLFDAYGITNMEDYEWEQILKAVEETIVIKTENQLTEITGFIKDKMSETNRKETVPKPSWVTRRDGETLESYQDCKFEESNVLDTVLSNLEINEKDSETLEEIKRLCYSIKDNINTSNSPSFQRLYGPYNQIPGFKCITSHTVSSEDVQRPCQMLTCMCREFDDDDLEEEFSGTSAGTGTSVGANALWFGGYCLTCNKTIEKYTYAVRFPVDGGGWQGCYCGFECAKKTLTRIVSENDKSRIDDFEEILNDVGIFDV